MNVYKPAVIGLFVLTTVVMASSQQPETDGPPRIEFFSPQGNVKNVRQAQVRFSAQIVPFGDPREVKDSLRNPLSRTRDEPLGGQPKLGL